MDAPEKPAAPSPAPGRLRMLGPDGAELEPAADATFEPRPDSLLVLPRQQPQLRVDFADVDGLEPGDHVFSLVLSTGERVEASMLGRRFDQTRDAVAAALADYQSKNLLLEEPVGGEEFGCDVERDGEQSAQEGARLRVFATSLAVLPQATTPYGISLGEVTGLSFDEERYAIDLATASAGRVSLLKMGRKTQPCLRLLEDRLTQLRKRTSDALAFLVPSLPTLPARRLAQAMQDGVPARKSALDAISPTLWDELLSAAVGEASLRESVAALASRCPAGEIAVGLKETNFRQDEEGEEEVGGDEGQGSQQPEPEAQSSGSAAGGEVDSPMKGRVVWFAFPICAEDRSAPGNAVAVEAATRGGRATYLFRIAPPDVYRDASWEELLGLARDRILSVSRALVALGFKREPIYLPDQAIRTGRYARYRLALRLSAPLKSARATFVGRAIHGAGWATQIDAALAKARQA